MPAYVYKCKMCEYTYEKKKRFNDHHDTDCPECGEAVRPVINNVGIVFKGSGFYVNDSKGSKSTTSPSGNGTEKAEKTDADKGDGKKKSDAADSSSSSDSSDKKESKPKESKKAEPTTAS